MHVLQRTALWLISDIKFFLSYVIRLWKNPVNILPMSNSVADDNFLLFIYCKADPVLTYSDLEFTRIALHYFVSTFDKGFWPRSLKAVHHRILHRLALPGHSSQ